MKQKRWIKSVIETAKSKEMTSATLPWQRGGARGAMIANRRVATKVARTA